MNSLLCIVCGIPIYNYVSRDATKHWLSQYRAIYRETSQAKITGVGRYDGKTICCPPRSPSERWDDNEHHGTIEFTFVQTPFVDDTCRGFFLHDSCSSLLQKSFEPTPIPLQRLLEVCESLPFSFRTSTLYWGHDFGGLWPLENRYAFLWQERFLEPRLQRSLIYQEGLEDPFNVSSIPNMLSEATRMKPYRLDKPVTKTSRDCFACLPWELLEEIASHLLTEDALNLRLASVSFLPLYFSEYFWASRFSADGERGSLFEARKTRGYLHWIAFYRLSIMLRRSSSLRNRQRVWSLARGIVDIAKRHRAETPFDVTGNDWTHSSLAWVSCDIRSEFEDKPYRYFLQGCRSFGTCIVTLPKDLLQIGISIIEMGVSTYVTGIRFISGHSHITKIGYIAEQNERMFVISGFYGFRVALSQCGIRALQLVHKTGHCSQWAGNPTEMLISNGLVKDEPIERLAISYDGFKLVGLAIDLQRHEKASEIKATDTLRQASWYPHPPPDRVCLNQNSLSYSQISHNRFQPFVQVDFGGPEGQYLPYITNIRARYKNGLQCIEFRYGPNPYNLTSKKLGCDDLFAERHIVLFEHNYSSEERITSISVAVQSQTVGMDSPQSLKGIRFSTNHGRSCQFDAFNIEHGLQQLILAEGTAIVGLYGHYDPDIGLYGLGLISTASKESGLGKMESTKYLKEDG